VLPQYSLAVVGADYPNTKGPTRRFEIALCQPGEPVELRPEPKNPADPRAVAVYSWRGVQLGYLSAERCGRIGALIREGREIEAIFQQATPFGAAIRVAFDGDVPFLPPERPAGTEQETDFYPDEEWPDD
jgi:hypothetical protein